MRSVTSGSLQSTASRTMAGSDRRIPLDRWGDFQTYFRFQLSPAGKINRLDIGQAT